MAEDFETPSSDFDASGTETEIARKKPNTPLIITIVVLVILCCFCLAIAGGLWWLWVNGDALIQELSYTFNYLLV